MISTRLALLLALQLGLAISFTPTPVDPQHNVLKQSASAIGIDSVAPIVTEPRFEQNSKLMYDDIADAMPWFIRKMVIKNMNNAIVELCEEQVVTEDDMYAIIAKITPKSNLQDSLKVLDKRKTCAPVDVADESAINAAHATFVMEEKVAAGATIFIAERDVQFEQNSKLMYDSILRSTPESIRKAAEKHMNSVIADLCEETVTELHMYEVIKQTTPKNFVKFSIDVLDQHKTTCEEEDHTTSLFMVADKEVCFEQNSKKMYDEILEDHPAFVRGLVKKNLDKAILEVCGEVMTETGMYEVINSASPKPLLKFNLSILDELKSS